MNGTVDGWYRAESGRATFAFRVEDGEVVETAPYGRKLIMGLRWATAYMKLEQGGFQVVSMRNEPELPRIQNIAVSKIRPALNELLRRYPGFDLVSIDWQIGDPLGRLRPPVTEHTGTWVLVRLGQPSENFDETPAWALWGFAIFKATGALHTWGQDAPGAVSDDPIWTP